VDAKVGGARGVCAGINGAGLAMPGCCSCGNAGKEGGMSEGWPLVAWASIRFRFVLISFKAEISGSAFGLSPRSGAGSKEKLVSKRPVYIKSSPYEEPEAQARPCV
jgi:hypothetical protein